MTVEVAFTVNGEPVRRTVQPRMSLADFLREELRLTGTHLGCEHGVCGACTVLVDGACMRSCLLFAVQAEGSSITTVEGLAPEGELNDLQRAFQAHHALQCGFCTPGFLTTAHAFLQENANPSEEEVRAALSGNICRCTGYMAIVEAVLATARSRAAKDPA
jgi:carbon-monoxide dehydrogenase small subunit